MNKTRVISAILVSSLAAISVVGQQVESGKLFEGQGVTLYYEVRGAKPGTPSALKPGQSLDPYLSA